MSFCSGSLVLSDLFSIEVLLVLRWTLTYTLICWDGFSVRHFSTWLFGWSILEILQTIGNCRILALLWSICIKHKKLLVNNIFVYTFSFFFFFVNYNSCCACQVIYSNCLACRNGFSFFGIFYVNFTFWGACFCRPSFLITGSYVISDR